MASGFFSLINPAKHGETPSFDAVELKSDLIYSVRDDKYKCENSFNA